MTSRFYEYFLSQVPRGSIQQLPQARARENGKQKAFRWQTPPFSVKEVVGDSVSFLCTAVANSENEVDEKDLHVCLSISVDSFKPAYKYLLRLFYFTARPPDGEHKPYTARGPRLDGQNTF